MILLLWLKCDWHESLEVFQMAVPIASQDFNRNRKVLIHRLLFSCHQGFLQEPLTTLPFHVCAWTRMIEKALQVNHVVMADTYWGKGSKRYNVDWEKCPVNSCKLLVSAAMTQFKRWLKMIEDNGNCNIYVTISV